MCTSVVECEQGECTQPRRSGSRWFTRLRHAAAMRARCNGRTDGMGRPGALQHTWTAAMLAEQPGVRRRRTGRPDGAEGLSLVDSLMDAPETAACR